MVSHYTTQSTEIVIGSGCTLPVCLVLASDEHSKNRKVKLLGLSLTSPLTIGWSSEADTYAGRYVRVIPTGYISRCRLQVSR